MKFIKRLFGALLVIAVLIVIALAYLGFVPGLSSVFGSDTPRDLGVVVTQADLDSVEQKLTQEIVPPTSDPHEQLLAASGNPVDITMTEAEYSQHIMRVHPVEDLQVTFGADGAFAASGKISRERIPAFVRTLGATGISDAEILETFDTYMPVDPVFYFEGTASGATDTISLNMERAELGRLPVDAATATEAVETYLQFVLDTIPGYSIGAVTIREGEMAFTGTATSQVPQY